MPDRGTVIYRYDGSFDGLLCCVFESFLKKEIPAEIHAPHDVQLSLLEQREITTDPARARRVLAAVPQKVGKAALPFVRRAFLTCLPQKEWYILQFLRLGFSHGPKIMSMLADEVVHTLDRAVRHLEHEAHLLTGFIRFSVYGDILAAQITPKNFVLPILAPHFAGRYPQENFLIYDKTHGMALTHEKGRLRVSPVEDFRLPAPDESERACRRLWRMFYRTIAVEGRENPRCRMSHMPKRYWANMTEFAAEYGESDLSALPIRL